MGVVVDSSVFIASERGSFDLRTKLQMRTDEAAAISAITVSELLHGVHRAAPTAVKTRREAFVERILSSLTVIPFDEVVARVHARLWATLASAGVTLGAHDLIIGATALAVGWSVATRDTRSFPKIPGLEVDVWR
jgi:predicted nucleic acid-binding protein